MSLQYLVPAPGWGKWQARHKRGGPRSDLGCYGHTLRLRATNVSVASHNIQRPFPLLWGPRLLSIA